MDWQDFRRLLGGRIAPPRFVLFFVVLAGALGVAVPALGRGRGFMAAFDGAVAVFLIAVATLFRRHDVAWMRRSARDNDANRAVLLVFTALATAAVLVAVAGEVTGRGDRALVLLVLATLVLTWLFSNVVYALHYAHLFYLDAEGGGDARGLDFPGTDAPGWGEFLYFSFTLGMTFQTSDVTVCGSRMRWAALGQSMAAFVFNLGVLAFTVNVLGGAG